MEQITERHPIPSSASRFAASILTALVFVVALNLRAPLTSVGPLLPTDRGVRTSQRDDVGSARLVAYPRVRRRLPDGAPGRRTPTCAEIPQNTPADRVTITIQLTVDEDQYFLARKYALEHNATLVELLQKTIKEYAASAAKTKAE
ncbi:hypothetical protein D2E25_1211 [Bifidobacterium goeldii]|uniref:Uncharacterized protein n=1 Tax=Bifidobacterium goeldii TaxID=2306975 RepID=A0A430FKK8_9BIFI|nr:hypothetical protein [Bifidobacterium goeldii]RSX53238.1 hypothetical protein D2E25_1211 [Bifidobacterium goeldii]